MSCFKLGKNLITSYDVQKYVASYCKRVGLSVEFVRGATPSFNGRTMRLPAPDPAKWTDDDYDNMKFFVKHETEHVAFTDMAEYEKAAGHNQKSLLANVVNILEDYRIDTVNDSIYEGDKRLSQRVLARKSAAIAGRPLTGAGGDYIAPLYAWIFGLSIYANHIDLHDTWASASSRKGRGVLKNLHDRTDLEDELLALPEIKDHRLGVRAVGVLARKIIDEVFKEDSKSMEQPPPEGKPDGEGKPQGGEGGKPDDGDDGDKGKTGMGTDDHGDDEGEGKSGKDKPKPGDGDSDSGDGDPAEGKTNKSTENKIIEIDSDKTLTGAPMNSGNKSNTGIQRLQVPPATRGVYTPDEESKIEVFDYSKTVPPCRSHYGADIRTERDKCENFANLVRTKLQIASRDRFESGKKSGRLNKAVLYRAAIPDGGRASEALFKRRIINDTLDVCVQVLVDCSGSMGGVKYKTAATAAVLLSESIGNTLGIPTEILGFTETNRNRMFIFRKFDQKLMPTEHLIKGFDCAGEQLMNNVDGESIMFGYRRIKQRREKRRIMIVLSDGQPAGGGYKGDIDGYTRQVIKAIESDPTVEIVGIGILYDSVKEYYKTNDTVKKIIDLPPVLLNTIERKVLQK